MHFTAVAGMKATVVYSYDACEDDELSLCVGDIIHVVAQVFLLIYFIQLLDWGPFFKKKNSDKFMI